MVAIVDHNGKPFNSPLKGNQSSQIGSLAQIFEEHPSRGLTPSKLAQILEDAERGNIVAQHELFEDIEEKDGHVFSELSKRRMAPGTLPWSVEPPDEATPQEEEAARWAESLIKSMPFKRILSEMASAIGHGFSCIEYDGWRDQDGDKIPNNPQFRPQTWFTVDPAERNTPRLRDNSQTGLELQPFGWIVHIHKAKSGYLTRASLGRILAWPFIFKNYSLRDLAEFLEIYGLPLRLGRYYSGASDAEKSTLLRAVMNIGHNAAGIIPEGMSIEFQEAAKGASDPYVAMMSWCERTQSKAILGATLTSQTDSGSGAYALGQVHNEVRKDIRDSDCELLAETLTDYLIYPAVFVNFGIARNRSPRFQFDTQEPEDLKLFADALPQFVDIGLPIPVSYAQAKLRIPKPENNEPILQRSASPTPLQAPGVAVGKSEIAAENQQMTDAQQALTERLANEASDNIKEWLDVIKAKAETAGSLEELRDNLLSSYGDLDSAKLAKLMQTAFAAANLSGRFDVDAEQS